MPREKNLKNLKTEKEGIQILKEEISNFHTPNIEERKYIYKVLDIDFKDYKFSASDLPEFTSFQIKVVFNGTNSAYPARLKDFRAIALAV